MTGRAQAAASAEQVVVRGRDAWEVARREGFEFFPVIPDDRFLLSGARDGADSTLKLCDDARTPCTTEALMVGGKMMVLAPVCRSGCSLTHTFEMFAGRRLTDGWRLARVELAGAARWAREPKYDTNDASFAVSVEAREGNPGTASIERITLVGPAGADWRQAFESEGGGS
jgi:hypothetical protein